MSGSKSFFQAESLAKAAFAAGLVLITYLSLVAGTGPSMPEVSDKIKHAAAYAVLGVTGMFAFRNRPLWIAGFLFIWGILMEIGQAFVPLRTPEFADQIANATGITLAWLLFRQIQKCLAQTSRS